MMNNIHTITLQQLEQYTDWLYKTGDLKSALCSTIAMLFIIRKTDTSLLTVVIIIHA